MPACADFVLVSAPGKLRPGDDRPEHAAVRAGAPAGRKPRNTSHSEAVRRTSSRALKGFACLGMRSSVSPGTHTSPTLVAISNRWSLRMPRAGISVQHTACTRRAARRRVLARSFCAHFPLRASLAPSAPALASHGVLLTLQVESCTSPWLCTLLRLFLLSLSISAVRHRHKGRPSLSIVMVPDAAS